MRARGGQWRRLHGERRPAAVLCRCGGVPARRGGDGRARELRWDESKRIRGLVEGGVGSSGGSAWRGGWQPWRAAALRKRRRAGLAGDEASSAAARHSCNAPWRGAGLRGGSPRRAVAEAGQTSGHGAHTEHSRAEGGKDGSGRAAAEGRGGTAATRDTRNARVVRRCRGQFGLGDPGKISGRYKYSPVCILFKI